MRQKNKWLKNILCAALLAVLLCASAYAASGGTLAVNYSQNGVTFRVYQVATRQTNNTWEMTQAFVPYQVDLNSGDLRSLAATLAGYVARDGLKETASAETVNGTAAFSGLDYGLYLVVGDRSTSGDYIYTPVPFLVEVSGIPMTVDSKYDREEKPSQPETISYTVKKVWAGSGAGHPSSVTVQLLQDGNVYSEVTLNALNGWSHTWRGLDASSRWQVVEKEVPDGYTVSIAQDNGTFVVTNTLDIPDEPDKPTEPDQPDKPEEPDKPTEPDEPDKPVEPTNPTEPEEEPKLPQTGQLWWPVAALSCAGVTLLLFGCALRKKGRYEK